MASPSSNITCSICGLDEGQVSFSKRQRTKGRKQQTAKCTSCIDMAESSPAAPKSTSKNVAVETTGNPVDPTTPDLEKSIPRKKQKISHSRLLDDEASSDEDSTEHDVSLDAIKREVLGRDLHVETPGKEQDELQQIYQLFHHATTESTSLATSLQSELQCAICRDIHYPPLSLHCGHSFCQECLEWWWKTSPTCPTCRAEISGSLPQVNSSLKQCMLGLYPSQVVQRLQTRKNATAGEDGGRHSRGYEVLSPLEDEFWHSIATPSLKVRRNVVLDADDQRMQVALALYQPPVQLNNGLVVSLCLLTMEEDEASDGGFPIMVSTHAEDEQLLCTNENRFRHSLLRVEMTKEDGSVAPVARVSLEIVSPGFVEFMFDASSCSFHQEARVIRFQHEDTGATLELDLSLLQKGATGASFVSMEQRMRQQKQQQRKQNRQSMVMEQLDEHEDDDHDHDDEEDGHDREENDDDEEEDEGEGERLDEFEDDGFVVQDTSDMEGAFSDNDDDDSSDVCVYCKDGGNLMICDGGTEMDGCGKSFHHECVDLPSIPEGDWVCSNCATEGGIEVVGKQGHEFSVPKIDNTGPSKKRHLTDDSSSDDENDDDEKATKNGGSTNVSDTSSKNNKQNKRRIVLDDSDED